MTALAVLSGRFELYASARPGYAGQGATTCPGCGFGRHLLPRGATQGRLGGCLVSRVAAEDQDRLAARLVDAEVRAHEPDLLALEGVTDLVADEKTCLPVGRTRTTKPGHNRLHEAEFGDFSDVSRSATQTQNPPAAGRGEFTDDPLARIMAK